MASRRESDADADDRFRGLYITDDQVDRLLGDGWVDIGADPAHAPTDDRPARKRRRIERRRGRPRTIRCAWRGWRGWRPRSASTASTSRSSSWRWPRTSTPGSSASTPTCRTTSRDAGPPSGWPSSSRASRHGRLAPAIGWAPGGGLARAGLIELEGSERPALGRPLRVPDRVLAHLLGSDDPDPALRPFLVESEPVSIDEAEPLAAALGHGVRVVYLRDRVGAATAAAAAAALRAMGMEAVHLDLASVGGRGGPRAIVGLAVREAGLRSAGIVAGPIDAPSTRLVRTLGALVEGPMPVILFGSAPWDPTWTRHEVWLTDAPDLLTTTRARLWQLADEETATRMSAFRLAPEQILRARRSAHARARARGDVADLADLQAGARSENATGLDRLARRVEPRADWSDLVVPRSIRVHLEELHRGRAGGTSCSTSGGSAAAPPTAAA